MGPAMGCALTVVCCVWQAQKQKEKEAADKAAGKAKRRRKKGIEKVEVISNLYEGEWNSGKRHG